MNFANTRKKAVSLLLILAMLTVLVAALIPIVSTADGDEIQDFGYQAPTDYTMLDESTNLRFVFTVPEDKLPSYTAAGFVFSKSVAEPTVDGENCKTASASAAYRSITADGETKNASNGRYWIAVKMTNIPQEYFDGPIYVRAFVDNGEDVTYSAAKEISVWGANAIEYFTKWDEQTWNGMEYSEKDADYADKKYGEPSFIMSNSVNAVRGEKHFYPTNENPDGNDLLIEFSFLYNSTQASLGSASELLAVTYVQNYNLFNINLKTGVITASERAGDAYVYPTPEAIGLDSSLKSVSIGEYGWHRFAVRIHQEAKNVAGEINDTITATAYLDGVKILEVDKTTWVLSKYKDDKAPKIDARLFIATATGEGENDISYSDIANGFDNEVLIQNQLFYYENSAPINLILEDVSLTCGKSFAQQVTKVESPDSRTYHKLHYRSGTDEPTLTAPVFYKELNSDPLIFNGKNNTAPDGWGSGTQFAVPNQLLSDIAEEKGSFYPTDKNPGGNDMLVEFSILWNESLTTGSEKALNLGVFTADQNSNPKVDNQSTSWFHLDDKSSDCPFAGGIELSLGNGTVNYGPDNNPTTQYAEFAHIGDYGWHRIGIRYHQTAVIDGENVAYTLTYSIYVDGVKVYEVLTDSARYVEKDYLLYNATIDENDHSKLNYTDNTADQEVNKRGFRWLVGVGFFHSASDKWLVLSDYYITSGHDFVQRVEPVASPAAATINLGGVEYPAATYYKLAD